MRRAGRECIIRWGLAVAVLGWVGAPAAGVAQSRGAERPDEDEVEEFKRRLARGVEHYRAERYESALEAFREASKIATPPSLQYKIGRTLEELNRCGRARDVYEAYLENEGLSDEKRARGERRLEKLSDTCRGTGTIAVICRPSDREATFQVADREVGCGAEVEVETGEQLVELENRRGERRARRVDVRAGETTETTFQFERSGGRRVDDERPLGWKRGVQIAGLVVGGGFLVAGLWTDLRTQHRLTEIRRAERAENYERVGRLERRAGRARTATTVFYTVGGVVTAASGLWLLIDGSGEERGRASSKGVVVRPGVSTIRLSW